MTYRHGVLVKMLAVCFLVLALGAGVSAVLKGKNVISAFGDRLENPDGNGDGDGPSKSKRKICRTLDGAARHDLIGRPTPVKLLDVEGELDPYTCRWAVRDFKTVSAFVEVVAAPADTWVVAVRGTLASTPMDPAQKQRLMAMANQPDLTRAEGCRFARAVFVAGGAPTGADRTVTTSMTGTSPTLTAHSCSRGTYYAVLVAAPGLSLDDSLARKASAALRRVEQKLS